MDVYLPLLVAVPLGAAFLLPIIHKARAGEWAINLIAVLVCVFTASMSFGLFASGGALESWMGGWTGAGEGQEFRAMGISLICDGLTRLMLITVNTVALAAAIFSLRYIARFTAPGLYFSLFFVMVAGMNGVVLAGDLFNLYVFLEVAAVASYALVAFGTERDELEASFKYLVLGGLASTFILFGVAICYNLTGSLNMARVSAGLLKDPRNMAALLAGGFFLMGFGLKAAMVPFHAWLPDAHPAAPAPISAMLSGVLIKALGIYCICRVAFNVIGVAQPVPSILMTLGALSMLAGAFLSARLFGPSTALSVLLLAIAAFLLWVICSVAHLIACLPGALLEVLFTLARTSPRKGKLISWKLTAEQAQHFLAAYENLHDDLDRLVRRKRVRRGVAILLPPVAVLLCRGGAGRAVANCILTLLGWIPGMVHAMCYVGKSMEDIDDEEGDSSSRHAAILAALFLLLIDIAIVASLIEFLKR